MNELQQQFLAENEELIEKLFSTLHELRARRSVGRVRRELTGQIFRQVHTLKGSAAAAEIESVSILAHEFETVLDGLRLGRLALDVAMLDTFEDAAHAISESLAAAGRQQSPAIAGELLERLRSIADSGCVEESGPVIDSRGLLPTEVARALSKYDEQRLREAVEEGARVFIVSANFPVTAFDQEFRDLSEHLAAGGEIVATVPATQIAAPGEINFRVLYATAAGPKEIAAQIGSTENLAIAEIEFERKEEAQISENSAASLPRVLEASQRVSPTAGTVRVNLAELDDLIARASELFRDTTNALELTAPQAELARIQQQFLELEDRLIKLRMVRLAQTFERAARAGRIAARATGKDISFEMVGSEVAIDKSLADAIGDPLMHLVRNAVDHGIEVPADRRSAGKNSRGCVRLIAIAESNRIQIYVEDDGRGIDPAHVARIAAAGEIVADPSLVTMDQCLRLIFRPGFSTTRAVSNTSGRGIGLEIVDRAMEEVGGEVRVRTEPGHGTIFQMVLPATLAIVRSILARAGHDLYCIDARHVLDTGALEANEIETAAGKTEKAKAQTNAWRDSKKIKWRDKNVPLVYLRELLGQAGGAIEPEDLGFLIIRSTNGLAFSNHEAKGGPAPGTIAVAVDSIEGEHEALVRSLGRHASRWRGVAGATELRDGTVALVLDLPTLLETVEPFN